MFGMGVGSYMKLLKLFLQDTIMDIFCKRGRRLNQMMSPNRQRWQGVDSAPPSKLAWLHVNWLHKAASSLFKSHSFPLDFLLPRCVFILLRWWARCGRIGHVVYVLSQMWLGLWWTLSRSHRDRRSICATLERYKQKGLLFWYYMRKGCWFNNDIEGKGKLNTRCVEVLHASARFPAIHWSPNISNSHVSLPFVRNNSLAQHHRRWHISQREKKESERGQRNSTCLQIIGLQMLTKDSFKRFQWFRISFMMMWSSDEFWNVRSIALRVSVSKTNIYIQSVPPFSHPRTDLARFGRFRTWSFIQTNSWLGERRGEKRAVLKR